MAREGAGAPCAGAHPAIPASWVMWHLGYMTASFANINLCSDSMIQNLMALFGIV